MTNVIIIGRGRRALVQQTIDSLYANTDQEQFNCVFVADTEDDFRILRYLRGIQRKNFSLLEVSSGSSHVISQLKNLGAYWSEQRWGRGDWLYFSDNDVVFLRGWHSKLMTAAEKTESLGFRLWGGQAHPFHKPIGEPPTCIGFGCTDDNRGQVYVQSVGHAIPADCAEGITEHAILDGPSWLMRWETWDQYGPFRRDTAPGVCQSEEYPFCQRLTLPIGLLASRTEYEKYIDENRGMHFIGGMRIGVTYPHCVIHTGLTQSDGKEAPGAAERRLLIPPGVLAE